MATSLLDLWTLTRGRPQIDPNDLAEAIVAQVEENDLDYRTRLLIRDSVNALRQHWGERRVQDWFAGCPQRDRIEQICHEQFDKVGFPSLPRRLMDKTKPELIRQFLEHLGRSIRRETRVEIAGIVPCIMMGFLSRHTDDIDLIDEVPKDIRENHQLLEELQGSYGLELTHVQAHYYPSGWKDRIHHLGDFGRISAYMLDVHDIFLSKLFSARVKDMGDMRMLKPQLNKATLIDKLGSNCRSFLAEMQMRQVAHDNWYILFGEELPQ